MITPQQAKEMTPEDLEVAKEEEQRIDAALRGFEDKKSVPLRRGLPRKICEHLRSKYVGAGWHVIFHSETQRDEPYFEFTIPSPGCSMWDR